MQALRWSCAALALALGTSSRVSAQSVTPGNDSSPLSLAEVLGRAVTQHPLVEAARARVRGAHGSRLTARSFGNPVLSYQVENAPFPGRSAPAALDREVSLFATLPLEPLFQRWSRVRAASEEVNAAEAELDLARRAVSLDAAHAFYRVALAQAAVRGAIDVRDRLGELAAFTRSRVREGVTSEGDWIRVQVEQGRAEAELALEQVELARARGQLAPFLGATQVTDVGLAPLAVAVDSGTSPGAMAATSAGLGTLASYTARARTSRPDLVAARARVAAARATAGYERALTLRQLGATFGAKRIGDLNTMIAGIALPLPLFDQNRGEVQRARAERSAVEQELAWRERQVTAEVAAAYEGARLLADQRARFSDSLVARAEESRRITLVAYREGAATLLQVLDASRTLGEARLAWYRTLIAQRESVLELTIVSGSELPGMSPTPPARASSLARSPDSRAAGRDGTSP